MPDLADLIHFVGQAPLRSGRVGLAAICWRSDFDAYRLHGRPLTGATPAEAARYVAARTPGEPRPTRGLLDAAVSGWRWGRVEHALLTGTLRRADAEWVAEQWREGVPV